MVEELALDGVAEDAPGKGAFTSDFPFATVMGFAAEVDFVVGAAFDELFGALSDDPEVATDAFAAFF